MVMRSLNLDQLRTFVEVAKRGSFTAAAKELNLSQPAVTHQVHELEQRFNVPLLERLGKRAYPTQAGEKLLEHARYLLDEDSRTRASLRKFADGWLGRVRIGTSMTVLMYVLPPILRKLKTERPQLEINLKGGLSATTLELLKRNALDLGLCALPIEDAGFDILPLFTDELMAILPASLGPAPKKATPAFLAQCPLILGNKDSALRRTAANWLSLAGPVPKPVMEFDNVEAIKSVVAVGLGASILPSLSLGPGHAATTKTFVVPLSPRVTRQVGLVKLSGKRDTEAMELVSTALLMLRGKTYPARSARER
jgi:DNA-binding transcriptional LysR family regulator